MLETQPVTLEQTLYLWPESSRFTGTSHGINDYLSVFLIQKTPRSGEWHQPDNISQKYNTEKDILVLK
jgi:hypothetical protein